MNAANPQHVALQTYLAPILPWLEKEGVSEISINRPGEGWIELYGDMQRVELPTMDLAHLMQLARLIATATEQEVSEEKPLLSATLPQGHRVQIVFPPAAEAGTVCVSIRKPSTLDYSLKSYEEMGAFDATKAGSHEDPADAQLLALYKKSDFPNFIRLAVRSRKNIIISGGTSTGKTTALNACLKEVPEIERLITVEDAREVVLPHQNRVHLLSSRGGQGRAQVTPQNLIEACLRLRPDRIIMGELRGAEAFSFLRAINTGHPGSIATVHADTPMMAFEQLVLMVMQASLGLDRAQVLNYIKQIVHVVIQVKRGDKGRRYFSEIYYSGAVDKC